MGKDQFRREMEKELTGKETEASELAYFKLYKSQISMVRFFRLPDGQKQIFPESRSERAS